jgi:hypothetical protein
MITGAPGNAFFVKTAAKLSLGLSSARIVTAIFDGFGASTGVKSNFAVAHLKPDGSADCVASHARWDALELNSNDVLGTNDKLRRLARVLSQIRIVASQYYIEKPGRLSYVTRANLRLPTASSTSNRHAN